MFLQEYDSAEAIKPEAQEKEGIKCGFDKTLEGMCLRPIYLIFISTVPTLEKLINIFVGQSASVK